MSESKSASTKEGVVPESKKVVKSIGQMVEVSEDGVVVRPDGSATKVIGGLFVLMVPGTYVVDGVEIEAQ